MFKQLLFPTFIIYVNHYPTKNIIHDGFAFELPK